MQFLNPNVSGDMAQLLQHNHEKYVPRLTNATKKTILTQIHLHGDQLFEERARNVEWAMRDGQNNYDRLEGVPPEHADWHAKVTLYKVNYHDNGSTALTPYFFHKYNIQKIITFTQQMVVHVSVHAQLLPYKSYEKGY